MANLIMLVLALIIIFAVARYNRSNNLFWQLSICFLLGFACGHLGRSSADNDRKEKGVVITVSPTHQSSAIMPSFIDDAINCTTEETRATMANYASLAETCDIMTNSSHCTTPPGTINPELDIGKPIPFDTS